ncbi:hypothetical protein ACJVC5_01670 [Peredibacter sp. HCB2-198]|uniref:hypothetical protein n=1 Tax=Peredibacter sp. HCB2-198 TaxID=3383025 RepID=UPI0038B635C3
MKKLLLLATVAVSTSLMAAPNIPESQQLGSIEIHEISSEQFKKFNGAGIPAGLNNPGPIPGGFIGGGINGGFTGGDPNQPQNGGNNGQGGYNGGGYTGGGYYNGSGDRIETAGRVIQTARDFVALGEAIYELVQKGKPKNQTEYAPISVVPRDPMTKEYVDVFDLEGFSMPVEKNYVANIKNKAGAQAVTFTYKVMYSYGGSYNGAGKYLTNVIIIPGSVKTSYGWDFNATMKLSGMMNHGTRAEPVAGIMVTLKYQMNSWSAAYERNDTIHITGNGELKSFLGQ